VQRQRRRPRIDTGQRRAHRVHVAQAQELVQIGVGDQRIARIHLGHVAGRLAIDVRLGVAHRRRGSRRLELERGQKIGDAGGAAGRLRDEPGDQVLGVAVQRVVGRGQPFGHEGGHVLGARHRADVGRDRLLEQLLQLAGIDEARARVDRQCAPDDLTHRRRRVQLARRRVSGQQMEQQGAGGVDIAHLAGQLAERQLRGQKSAQLLEQRHLAGLGRRRDQRPGHAEVGQHDAAVEIDKHAARVHRPVHDAQAVGAGQPLDRAQPDGERDVERQRAPAASAELAHRDRPADRIGHHHHVVSAAPDLAQCDHPRVIERQRPLAELDQRAHERLLRGQARVHVEDPRLLACPAQRPVDLPENPRPETLLVGVSPEGAFGHCSMIQEEEAEPEPGLDEEVRQRRSGEKRSERNLDVAQLHGFVLLCRFLLAGVTRGRFEFRAG
jgi:hypothetical protein